MTTVIWSKCTISDFKSTINEKYIARLISLKTDSKQRLLIKVIREDK